MISYFSAFLDDDVIITIIRALNPLPKDVKILILDKIIEYVINRDLADNHDYDYWDDNFHTGYPDYDSTGYYTD